LPSKPSPEKAAAVSTSSVSEPKRTPKARESGNNKSSSKHQPDKAKTVVKPRVRDPKSLPKAQEIATASPIKVPSKSSVGHKEGKQLDNPVKDTNEPKWHEQSFASVEELTDAASNHEKVLKKMLKKQKIDQKTFEKELKRDQKKYREIASRLAISHKESVQVTKGHSESTNPKEPVKQTPITVKEKSKGTKRLGDSTTNNEPPPKKKKEVLHGNGYRIPKKVNKSETPTSSKSKKQSSIKNHNEKSKTEPAAVVIPQTESTGIVSMPVIEEVASMVPIENPIVPAENATLVDAAAEMSLVPLIPDMTNLPEGLYRPGERAFSHGGLRKDLESEERDLDLSEEEAEKPPNSVGEGYSADQINAFCSTVSVSDLSTVDISALNMPEEESVGELVVEPNQDNYKGNSSSEDSSDDSSSSSEGDPEDEESEEEDEGNDESNDGSINKDNEKAGNESEKDNTENGSEEPAGNYMYK